jgi:hypothetical protein
MHLKRYRNFIDDIINQSHLFDKRLRWLLGEAFNINLTNYGKKKSRIKPLVSADRRDVTVSADSAGRQVPKNRIFILEKIIFLFLEK